MKSKIISAVCAFALALALPTLAFAQGSVQGANIINDTASGVYIEANLGSSEYNGHIALEQSSTTASKADLTNALFSYNFLAKATSSDYDYLLDQPATITVTLGSKYANCTAKLFADHHNGTSDVHNANSALDANGSTTFTLEALSNFTLVVYNADGTVAATSTDTSAVSPKTGYDFDTMALASTGLLVAGVGVLALRKKLTA
jgi:LPXTG-motif cell wall-anchored protein